METICYPINYLSTYLYVITYGGGYRDATHYKAFPGIARCNSLPITDTSLRGWGAYVQGESVAGTWTKDQSNRHVNWLDLTAVFLALKLYLHRLHHKCVLTLSDNTRVVTYQPSRGTRSPTLCYLAWEMLTWAHSFW